ncbi:hypothetical protein DV735_g3100, partial [Chaetothyriales sp. CBS 134920]
MLATPDNDSICFIQPNTQPQVQPLVGPASLNDRLPRTAPIDRSKLPSQQHAAAERARLEAVVQQRIARLPLPQQLARVHPKHTAARTSSTRTRTGHAVRSSSEEWFTFVQRLSALPRTRPPRDGNDRSVKLTTAFVKHYTGSNRANSWIEDVGSRAVVELHPSPSPEKQACLAFLHGSDRAVELAKLRLSNLQAEFESVGPRGSTAHAADLTLNTIDSVSSFAQFVKQTTNRHIPPAIQRDGGRSFVDSMSDALMAMFEHPVASRFASIVALHDALRFLCRHNYHAAAERAHSLYHIAKSLGLIPGISTFNILLESAIRTGNAKRALFFLREMDRENISPNSHTWTLLFSIRAISNKSAILQIIMESGIPMNRQGFAVITRAAITDLLPNRRPSCADLQTLFADLEHIFGPDWLTLDSYHHLLRLYSFNPREGVVALLNDLPAKHGLKLVPGSFPYLEALKRTSAITPDRISHFIAALQGPRYTRQWLILPRFFKAAWRRSFYNMCHVLWSFAATRGLITQQMQRLVNRYLVDGGAHTSSRTVWRKRIGSRIIVGGQLPKGEQDVSVMRDVFPKLAKRFPEQVDARRWLTGFTADDGTRDEQMSLFFATLHDEIGAWKRFKPMSYDALQSLLQKAYEMDRRWVSEGKLEGLSEEEVSQAVDQAIRVRLTRLADGETNLAVQQKVNQRNRLMDVARLSRRPSLATKDGNLES